MPRMKATLECADNGNVLRCYVNGVEDALVTFETDQGHPYRHVVELLEYMGGRLVPDTHTVNVTVRPRA